MSHFWFLSKIAFQWDLKKLSNYKYFFESSDLFNNPRDLNASSTNKPVTFDWLNSLAVQNFSIISWTSSLGKKPILFLGEGIINKVSVTLAHYKCCTIFNLSQLISAMHILIFPAGFFLWYLAYEAKPIINDEVTLHWEEKNTNKRYRLLNINK